MNLRVALDTQTVIYALGHGEATPDEELRELRRRAHILLGELNSDGAEVLLPSVVVGELLAGVAEEDQSGFLAALQGRFFMPSYDVKAAGIAADLWRSHAKFPKDEKQERRLLKADVLVIATAKAAGATVIFSHDKNARKIASLVMTAKDLPTNSSNLYVDHESRNTAAQEGPVEKPKK
jgi:predicted nucleic acid-binding protein